MQSYAFTYPVSAEEIEAESCPWGWWLLALVMSPSAQKKGPVEYATFCIELRDRYKLPGALALYLIALNTGYGEVPEEEFKANLEAAKRPDCLELFVTNRTQFDLSMALGEQAWRDFANRNEG